MQKESEKLGRTKKENINNNSYLNLFQKKMSPERKKEIRSKKEGYINA